MQGLTSLFNIICRIVRQVIKERQEGEYLKGEKMVDGNTANRRLWQPLVPVESETSLAIPLSLPLHLDRELLLRLGIAVLLQHLQKTQHKMQKLETKVAALLVVSFQITTQETFRNAF